MIDFQWDERKNGANTVKHGVSFEEAKSVFFDEFARLIPDPDHSATEDRFILLGMSSKLRVLTVVHCYKCNETTIRIISARRASRKEKNQYEEYIK